MMSRSLILKRLCSITKPNLLLQNNRKCMPQIISRKAHGRFYYRELPPDSPPNKFSLFLNTAFWWWLFWNLFTEYELLLGHKYPDPSKWTDEELGIPPED